MEVNGNFKSPAHPILIALNNIKQEIGFISDQPEVVQLPPSLREALVLLYEEFEKVKGDTKP